MKNKGGKVVNKNVLRSLLEKLPDSPMKQQMLGKMAKKKDGLHDEFQVAAKGHIRIEEINEDGEAVGVLADKKNLVVDGAQHILLRAFAGDTERTLYLNRVPKATNGISPRYHIRLDRLTETVNGQMTIAHNPNVLWAAINESDFDLEYAFNPMTMFIKEETSNEPGQIAFTVSKTQVSGSVPLPAEIYSGFSNYFIGLGDGVSREMEFADGRLVKHKFAVDADVLKATETGAKVTIDQKVSFAAFTFLKSNKGGQVEIKVNDVVNQTVETYDSNLADDVKEEIVVHVEELDFDKVQKIELTFVGADTGVTAPVIELAKVETDAIEKKDKTLIREFKNFENRFDTVEIYNTLPTPDANGHYVFRLLNFPAVKGSVKINYDATPFAEVATKAELVSGKFFVDHTRGYVYLAEAMTGLAVTFETTGEIYEDQRENLLVSKTISAVDVKGGVVGDINGSNRVFQPAAFVQGVGSVSAMKVYVNGALTTAGFSVSGANVTFSTAPAQGTVIELEYNYSIPVRAYVLSNEPKGDVVVYDAAHEKFEKATATVDISKPGFTMINPANSKEVLVATRVKGGGAMTNIDLTYLSDERPGVPTGYKRAVIQKPKKMNEYPWFRLDRGEIQFVAEYKESTPFQSVTIREMGLFDGPRQDDGIRGYTGYPVNAFSLVRVAPTRKDTKTGIRVTWTITLTDEEGKAFKG